MRTKHLIISILLLCLLVTLSPVPGALAAPVQHFHPRVSFDIPIDSAAGLSGSGDAYLTGDISLNSDIVINEALSLCLNGYKIDIGSYTITVAKDASLNIYDCPESTAGTITASRGEKAAIEVFGTLNIVGGQLYTEDRSLVLNKGETTISGGKISGKDAQLIQTIGSAMLGINAGEISAKGNASAIAMISAPEDETAGKRDFNAFIGGGLITAEADSPGAVIINAPHGRFVINSGANIRCTDCPGIKVEAGNFDAYGGAVVYSGTDSAIVGTGGNVNLYFATITSDEKYGVDISADAQLLLSGSLDIVGGSAGVRLAKGKVFTMSEFGFYGDVRLSILTEVDPTEDNPVPISTKCEAKHTSHFISSNPSAGITYNDGIIYNSYDGSISHSHDGRNYVIALHSGYSDLSKNNYFLEADTSCPGFFTGSVVNICLNGHTLNLSNAIKLYPGSTLNIYDCQGTGKIQCNSTCIQDINNGNARVIIHQGTIVSNSGTPVKLTGDDTVILKGGTLMSVYDGSCAIEAAGVNNSVIVESGSIEGLASGIRVQDGQLSISGSETGSISGGIAIECSGIKEGLLTLDGSPVLNGENADIYLATGKLIAAGNDLAPSEKYTIAADSTEDIITLSSTAEKDISEAFTSADPSRAVMSGEENVLQLVRSLPAIPESAEIYSGENAEISVDHPGDGAAEYQWYIKKAGDDKASAVDGAVTSEFTSPLYLESGNYIIYCKITDETGTYVTNTVDLTIKKDHIENVNVEAVQSLPYTGEAQSVQISTSASTTRGRSVSFTYSNDGNTYSELVPAIGPEPGTYEIHYKASAPDCEDVDGKFTVTIEKAEEKTGLTSISIADENAPRMIAIIASAALLIILCIIYLVQKLFRRSNR